MKNTKSKTKAYLTSWCGGMGCDNCKVCLIVDGKAELIEVKGSVFKYRIKEELL